MHFALRTEVDSMCCLGGSCLCVSLWGHKAQGDPVPALKAFAVLERRKWLSI